MTNAQAALIAATADTNRPTAVALERAEAFLDWLRKQEQVTGSENERQL